MATDPKAALINALAKETEEHIAIWCEVTGSINIAGLCRIMADASDEAIAAAQGDPATFFMDYTTLPHSALTGFPFGQAMAEANKMKRERGGA